MIAIIDADSICFTAACDRVLRNESGEVVKGEDGKSIYVPKSSEQIRESIDKLMLDVLNGCNTDSYVAFIKAGCGLKNFRHLINLNYKSNRSDEEPHWWLTAFSHLVNKWSAIPVQDYEVDDYVNATRYKLEDSFIVTVDKDLLNLTGTHYNWKKNEWVTVQAFQEEYWFWTDMITGQPGDGIKGLPGKGKAFAEKLLTFSGNYREEVLRAYCEELGERRGIELFYQTYFSLKILNEIPDFEIPEKIMFRSSPASFDLSTVI